jgi:Baseplate J-like protein
MPSPAAIATQIIAALAVTEPALDTTIGSPIRSIIDAICEVVSEQTNDQYLLNYQYTINAMVGANLTSFVQTFGFVRYPATRATGFVTLSRNTPATTSTTFPAGTLFSTGGATPVVFSTIVPTVLTKNTTAVNIPVIAQIAGSGGNVAANSITTFVSPVASTAVSRVTNTNATINGTTAESDTHLRARFTTTVFRSLTGTAQMFLGTALNTTSVTQANVLGATSTYTEQIHIQTHKAYSSNSDVHYLYPNTSYLSNNSSGVFYTPTSQFTLVSTPKAPPTINTLTAATNATGHIKKNTKYWYALTVVNKAGESAIGTIKTVTTGSSSTTYQVTVTWTSVPSGTWTAVNVYRLVPKTTTDGDDPPNYTYQRWCRVGQVLLSTTPTVHSFIDRATTTAVGTIYAPANDGTATPLLTAIDTANVPDGIYDLMYNYASNYGRNTPTNNLTNKVDLYVNGTKITESLETTTFTTTYTFNITGSLSPATAATSMHINLWRRLDGSIPTPGNYFMPLTHSPITDMSDGLNANAAFLNPNAISTLTISATGGFYTFTLGSHTTAHIPFNNAAATIQSAMQAATIRALVSGTFPTFTLALSNGTPTVSSSGLTGGPGGSATATLVTTDYTYGVDYWIVNMRSPWGNSPTSRCGLEFKAANAPPNNTVFTGVDYLYNATPTTVQTALERWRLVTTDVQVHQVSSWFMNYYLAVVLAPGFTLGSGAGATFSPSATYLTLQKAIQTYLNSISFDGIVEVSRIIAVCQSVPNVTAVRFINSGDTGTYQGLGPLNGTTLTGNNAYYAIQRIDNVIVGNTGVPPQILATYATTTGTPFRATNVQMTFDALPVLNDIYVIQLASNNFGAV